MKAVVVYESLWGSTRSIARAIAEGLGPGAVALSTAEANAGVIAAAELLVAGAPVHALSLPTEGTRESARTGSLGPAGVAPDLSHPPMRRWLENLAPGHGLAAAFDTRVQAWYGRGAASRIRRGLVRAGYRMVAKERGFYVSGGRVAPSADGILRPGEVERAREWGAELAAHVR